eukprot:gene9981-biopygen5832
MGGGGSPMEQGVVRELWRVASCDVHLSLIARAAFRAPSPIRRLAQKAAAPSPIRDAAAGRVNEQRNGTARPTFRQNTASTGIECVK